MRTTLPSRPSPHALQRIRVLIADPDHQLLAEYRTHSRKGFEVITARDGLECVERLREQAPDVLVLEPELPWGGGDGVLAMMHDELNLADVPVMVLSSCRDPALIGRVGRFPIRDYRTKPLSATQLVSRVHSLLENQSPSSLDSAGEPSVWRL